VQGSLSRRRMRCHAGTDLDVLAAGKQNAVNRSSAHAQRSRSMAKVS